MYEDGLRKAVRGSHDVRGSAPRHARELTQADRCAADAGLSATRPSIAAGEVATGELDAANEAEIVDRLRDQGLMPMQVARAAGGRPPARGAPRAARAAPRWFEPKTRHARPAARDHARARDAAARRAAARPRARDPDRPRRRRRRSRRCCRSVRDDVRGGKALSQALDARRDVFSRFYVNIVRAGEAGGALGRRAARASPTRWSATRSCARASSRALIYPMILIGVAVLSVMVLLVWVVPQFEQTFAQAGKALPLPTQVVVVVGTFMRKWWWAVARRRRARRCCGCGAGCARPAVRARWDARLLRLPLARRPRDQGRDRALRAHARDAARQRRDAARRASRSSRRRWATACSPARSTA